MSNVVLRAFFALLLAGTFGLRVSTSGMMWDCQAAAEHGQQTGHDQDANHGSHPAPAEHASGCECVGQSCSAAAVLPAARLTPARTNQAFVPVPASASGRLPSAGSQHLLPFANAPPHPRPPLPEA